MKNSVYLANIRFPVHRPGSDDIPEPVEGGVRAVHGVRADPAAEHAHRHDGQHLRARHRAVRERVGQTGEYLATDRLM